MQTKRQYIQNFKNRYHLNSGFIQTFLYLVGVADNPYKKCVEKILNRKPHEALAEDFMQVSNDFKNAFEKYKKQFATANPQLRDHDQV